MTQIANKYENRYQLYENCMKIIFELLIVCNTYLDGFDFLLLILVILSVLQLIIGVICQRKYKLLNNF